MSSKYLKSLRFFLCLIFVLFQSTSGFIQAQAWDRLLEDAQKALETRKYSTADSLISLIQENMKGDSGSLYKALALSLSGDVDLDQGNYRSAFSHYAEALEVLEQMPYNNDPQRSDILNKLGNYYMEIRDYNLALPLLDSTLQIRIKAYGTNHLKTADTYNNLGIAYMSLGDIDRALDYHYECQRIRTLLLDPPHDLLAQSLNNIGQCEHIKGLYDESIATYGKALDQYSSLPNPNQSDIADVLVNAGIVYYDQQNYARAIQYYNQALTNYITDLGNDHPYVALCHNNLANAYLMSGDTKQGLRNYELAMKIRKDAFGEMHPEVAQTHYNLAMYHLYQQNDYRKARQYFEACRVALGEDTTKVDFLSQINDHQLYLNALLWQARMEVIVFQDYDGDVPNLEYAAKLYEKLDHLLDYLRLRYESLGSKQDLAGKGHEIYSEAIETAFLQYQMSSEERFWHLAFYYSEKSKAVLLFDGLQRAHAESFGEIPDARLEMIRDLESQISLLEKERYLKTNSQSADVDSLDSQLFHLHRNLTIALERINVDYPKYFDLRYATNVPSIAAIQQDLIGPEESLISYFMGSTYLTIFVVNEDDFQVRNVGVGIDFDIYQDSLLASIYDFQTVSTPQLSHNLSKYSRASYLMYRYLIEPVRAMLKEDLVIIPDGRLNFIPFEALLQSYPDEVNNLSSLPYLVKKHPISYNYSVRALHSIHKIPTQPDLEPYLGFAPHFNTSINKELPELTFNDQEVEEASASLGGSAYLDEDATKQLFLKIQDKYQIIHLATHGLANRNQDDYSFLAFSQTADMSTQEDAYLYTSEIYNLRSNAEVIILSACETGTGKLYEGEGIASLARAFSYAGAASLVATRWNVNDRTTKDIINNFLVNLKEGLPKHKALHQSINNFIETTGQSYAHPFYWSSFMIIGDVAPVHLRSATNWILPVAGLVVLLLLIVIYLGRRNFMPHKSSQKETHS